MWGIVLFLILVHSVSSVYTDNIQLVDSFNRINRTIDGLNSKLIEIPEYQVNVINSVFEDMYSSSKSSCIYFSTSNMQIMEFYISHSLFYNCRSNSLGSIYLNSYSNLSIWNVCIFQCNTTNPNYGNFLFHNAPNIYNSKMEFVSIFRSPSYSVQGKGAFYIQSTKVQIISMNSTQNYGDSSLLYIQSPPKIQSSFCNYVGNYFNTGGVINCYSYGGQNNVFERQFKMNNFVVNQGTTSGGVIFNDRSYIQIIDSIFYNNHGTTYLFMVKNTALTNVSNCHINHLQTAYIGSGTFITPGSTPVVPNTPTFALSHFSSYYCQTEEYQMNLEVTPCITLPDPPTPPQSIPLSPTYCINPSDDSGNPLRILDIIHELLEATLFLINF